MTDFPAAAPPLDPAPAPADTPVPPNGARPRSIKVNFLINVAGAIVPLGVSLVTVPIYIRHIGDARYGVLSIVWVLLGYFGFLDLGLSRAAANALARLRDAPQEARARVLVTTLVLNLGMGFVGSLVLALAGSYLLQHILSVPDTLKPEISSAFPWIVALFPLALASGVGIGALESREEFMRANIFQVVGSSLGQIVPVLLTIELGPSLSVVIPAAAVVRGVTVLAILAAVWRREAPLRLAHFQKAQISGLLRYGGWVSLSGVISPLLTSLDQIVIGASSGVAAVSHYSIPMNLTLRSQLFVAALSRTLFPRLSNSQAEEAQRIASRAFLTVAFAYAPLCATATLLSDSFFSAWIGSDFAKIAAPVAEVLFLGAWLNGVSFVPFALLQSQGRPDVTGKLHALEVFPFLLLLWVLTQEYGLLGAAFAWSIRCAVDASLLTVVARIQTKHMISVSIPFALLCTSVVLAHVKPNWMFDASIALIFSMVLFTLAAMITTCSQEASELSDVARSAYRSITYSRLKRRHV